MWHVPASVAISRTRRQKTAPAGSGPLGRQTLSPAGCTENDRLVGSPSQHRQAQGCSCE